MTKAKARAPEGAAANDALPPAPINLDSITDIVHLTLRRDIAEGRYKPGVLRIRSLTERFGVSATPVREALRRLEAEGLVTLRNRRIMVKGVSERELHEIFAIRAVLEAFAIAEAARRGADDEALFDQLESLITEMDEAAHENSDRWREANQEFHMLIYELADNPHLMAIIDSLWVSVEPYLRLYVQAGAGLTTAQEEHRIMLDAIRNRDSDLAADVLRRHVVATEEIVGRGFAAEAAASE